MQEPAFPTLVILGQRVQKLRPAQLIPGTVILREVDLEPVRTHEKVAGRTSEQQEGTG